MSRRNGIIVGAVALIVVGMAFIKTPRPAISLAPEVVFDLGGYEITNTFISSWVVMALLLIVTAFLYRRLRHTEEALVPRGLQNAVEAVLEWFEGMVVQVAGEKNGRRFFPVVATIFLFLLTANLFGLFPWNNIVGKTVDLRAEWLETVEEDAHGVLTALEADAGPGVTAAAVNAAFGVFFVEPLDFAVSHREETNARLDSLFSGGEPSAPERAVRQAFRGDHAIPADVQGQALLDAIEERLHEAGLTGESAHEALLFNLPLPPAEIEEPDVSGAVLDAGGVNLVPLKAKEFEYEPLVEQVWATPTGGGLTTGFHLFNPQESPDAENAPGGAADVQAPLTLNSAHLGLALKEAREGITATQGTGEVFAFFRSAATDVNLPLAIALWAFIFVQFWGVRTLGVFNSIGKFLGFGAAKAAPGPIGVGVGLLEIVSELARIISFTFRLFGNIFAGEVILFMSAFLIPFLVASVFYGLEVFVSFIQAFVFAMLVTVFGVTAVSHGAHEPEEGHAEAGSHH